MSSTTSPGPVRLVLFDAFDTLCTPRISVDKQYYEEAVKGGLTGAALTPQSMREAFRPAFEKINSLWPFYGKHANPPLSPEEWWTKIIYETLLKAGAPPNELSQKIHIIAPALMSRFENGIGYKDFPETISCLYELRRLGVKTSIVSNSDPRILKTLYSLNILPLLSHPPTLSWDAEAAKPSPIIFQKACEMCEEEVGDGVIMVGDELKTDWQGAIAAGIEGRLIRWPEKWSNDAFRKLQRQLGAMNVIRSLEDVVAEVKRRNKSS
ncbi:hypothetical protein L204_100304 [Cryptococcus depauperatus]|nr:hypothetical protein L204_02216 [Cryptococcus depauperatus CBS 7855]